MTRVLVIARTEFLALVRSKFFLLGIIVVPIIMFGFITAIQMVEHRVDREDRRFAVIDATGELYATIEEAARAHNAEAGEADRTGPHFLPERVEADGRNFDELTVELSDRVRNGELLAFVYLPPDVLEPDGGAIRYYTQNTSYTRLSSWLTSTLNDTIQQRRLRQAGIDPDLVSSLTARTESATFELVERQPDGRISTARKVDEIQQFAIPIFVLIVMFMAVMSNTQHLITATVEEKMSKISEVILGSVSAVQLMAGKLLGIVAISGVLAIVYIGGGIYTLLSLGRFDLIDPGLIGWFVLFLVLATLLYGSLFLALSSSCSDLKDAQSMLQPAMLTLMVAYLGSFVILRAPDSSLAVAMSLLPPLTPFAMTLRLAMAPGPPLWQLLLSVVLLLGTTLGAVWVAGRIFRVGLLMQGKAPNLPELLRWINR